ncbi:MAG TPA: amino acid permease [Acidimicrobiales bacterium]|nr:amino acid permease [Acidimicrobiales bacterium]
MEPGAIRPTSATAPTAASPLAGVELPPDSLGYRIKNKLLGPPLHNEDLQHERLGKPTALAVFASDNLSSVAYGTEEILRHLIPFVGVAAFSLVMPITWLLVVMLGFLILSYRQTIKAYPTAGGAYVVTRDNFGPNTALVAGVSLLIDYVLTVAVSVSAGTAALTSAFSGLTPYAVFIAVGFIAIITYGNLRGVRESGRVFAVPTYFFLVTMLLMLAMGMFKHFFGHLPVESLDRPGLMELGKSGSSAGFLHGATLFIFLRAFASGGAAVTGVEAISNGVPAFKPPEWKNASQTLTVMGSTLGVMFLGLSFLVAKMHVAPFEDGTPTVISQVGKLIFGGGPLGHGLYFALQAGTMLILVLAANTSFADFPRLASFVGGDNFLPRQLMIRGHRLVFSNGIIALAAAATALVVVTGAKVDHLIPLYAVGVFTSFTLSQIGMAKHHWTLREEGWRRGLFINGTGAVITAVVDVVIGITKFKPEHAILGAWVIIMLVPVLVVVLKRLSHQYAHEGEVLEHDVPAAVTAPILKRHVVLVLVDRLDQASARAIQYARTLTPDELRAVHFVIDPDKGEQLRFVWERLGLSRVALELVDCPDRRLTRAAVETVALELADGETEVTVLLPDRKYSGFWHRILHDQTAESIVQAVSRLPHANVTAVPFHFGVDHTPTPLRIVASGSGRRSGGARGARSAVTDAPLHPTSGFTACGSALWRQEVKIVGTIHSMRVQPRGGVPSLECMLVDDTGGIAVVFLGRRRIAGIEPGVRIMVEGRVSDHHGKLAILNPIYQLLPS